MTKGSTAEKILRKINQTSFGVLLIISVINIFGGSLLAAMIEGENFIEKLLVISVVYGGIYIVMVMVIVSINMTHTGLDYLISLNVDRKKIFNAIVGIILRYTFILNVFFTILIVLNSQFGFILRKNIILFGMRGNQLNVLSYFILFLYLFIIGYFIMGYMMFIVLLAKRFGWHYLVGTILLTLSLVIIFTNEIELLFMIGNMIPVVFIGFAITCIVLTLINKMLIARVEYKR